MNTAGRALKLSLIGLLVIGTLVFAYFKTHDLVLGTHISISSPRNGATLTTSFVLVRGNAPESALLTINGAKVLTDATGGFEKEMLLGLGYNKIEVKSLDRFNRERKQVLELVYRPAGTSTATSEVAYSR